MKTVVRQTLVVSVVMDLFLVGSYLCLVRVHFLVLFQEVFHDVEW